MLSQLSWVPPRLPLVSGDTTVRLLDCVLQTAEVVWKRPFCPCSTIIG